jgi:tRNA(fMet)-specific endonuclease VapC
VIRYLIDTDHLTLLEQGDANVTSNVTSRTPEEIAISVVTVEESLRGRLALLARATTGLLRVRRYRELHESIDLIGRIQIVDYCDSSETNFLSLRALKLNVGTRDLRIASIALANFLVVVTRNRRDFGRVPGPVIEDWSRQ